LAPLSLTKGNTITRKYNETLHNQCSFEQIIKGQNNYHNLTGGNDVNNLSYSTYHVNKDQIDRKNIGFIKDKIKYLYLNPDDISINIIKEGLLGMKIFKENMTYAFLIKIRRVNETYKMAGGHGIWKTGDLSDNSILQIYRVIIDKLNNFVEDYSDEEMDLIQIMFIELDPLPKLKLKNINKLKLDKDLVNIGKIKKSFNDNYIPFSMNLNYYGEKLDYEINKKGYINKIILKVNDVAQDIYENIVYEFDNPMIKGGSKIILKKVLNKSNINIYINYRRFKAKYSDFDNEITRMNILIINDSNINQDTPTAQSVPTTSPTPSVTSLNECREIEVFTINDISKIEARIGDPKFVVYDTPLNKDKTEFIRRINDFSLHINNDKVIKYEHKIVLPVIKFKNLSLNKYVKNSNIGVFDIETYYDITKDKSFTYALGFKIFKGETKLFYKKPDQTSNDLIIECINSMLKAAYDKYIFYVHNLFGYDSIFILSALVDYNSKNNDYYKIKAIFRDNRIIKLEITINIVKSTRKITFVDSYLMIQSSLSKIAKDFECYNIKGTFPYEFVNEKNLYYIGNTPDKKYFNSISDDDYNIILSNNWDCKKETLKYLENDLNTLMEIIDKFGKYIYLNYNLQITDCLTISKLAINILYNNYINKERDKIKSLPLINRPNIYNFIKLSYFGGICEVYKPFGENLKYYDINSEYPFVAKNAMPGNLVTYMELQDSEVDKGNTLDLDNLFGFFYCKVKTTNNYLGLLPLHINNSLILPNGEFYGVWFSEELKFAKEHGYEIQVINGYHFNKVNFVFNKFVDDLYKTKLKATGIEKAITKLLLNSSFGRFGMSILKPETDIVDKKKLEFLLTTYKVLDMKQLNLDTFIVNYESNPSKKIIEDVGLDYSKILNSKKDIEIKTKFGFVSVSTASSITAYARIYINKIKLLILKLGGKLYYSDTDSIVTDIELPEELVGKDLGQFKLEYIVKKAIFITSKTYMLELEDGTIIKKAKGVNSNSLTINDYENMYLKGKDSNAEKTYSKLDFSEGTVNIYKKSNIIRHNSYTKREKIYNNEGLWIDSKARNFYSFNLEDHQDNT
jgi:hypothetical protein